MLCLKNGAIPLCGIWMVMCLYAEHLVWMDVRNRELLVPQHVVDICTRQEHCIAVLRGALCS